jgi:gluconate 5-dehydrogenase
VNQRASNPGNKGESLTPFSLAGKRALVTGASRGIGYGAAAALIEAGADVLLVARDASALADASQRLGPAPGVQFTLFDFLEVDRIAHWFDQQTRSFGNFDILVNNAGVTHRAPAVDYPSEEWIRIMEVNVRAVFELSRAFGKHCLQNSREGAIINIASLMAGFARPNVVAYIASKGAIGQLTKALAVEWAHSGIRVNAVAPGYIETDMNRPLMEDAKFDEWVKSRCPMRRWGKIMDIGWPIVFLASPAAAFITGQTLYVDGGWSVNA